MSFTASVACTSASSARIEAPECDAYWALRIDSGTSVLEVGAVFEDLAAAPRSDGSTIDLTRVPLGVEVDEIVLVNEAEGYRVGVEWDPTYLKSAMLWMSNRGRKGLPWGGTNLCLGVEPITSAFDFGQGVSAGDNPLAKAGYSTTVDFEAGRTYEVRHRIAAERIG